MVNIRMAAPSLAAVCDLADITALLRGAGAPLVQLADARMSSEAVVELDFRTAWSEPDLARRRVIDAVRERTSMNARFARWVVQAGPVWAGPE